MIFAFFPIGHHYVLIRGTSYYKAYRQKAALLFDKNVRKAELLHMVGMTGVEPAWTCSQNKWVTVTLHPDSYLIVVV